ncbi:energy transducer TonB [Acidobacteriota bacterium]
MGVKPKGITDHSIKAYWTIFFLIFSLLALTLVRVWISGGPLPQYETVYVEGSLNPPRVKTKVDPVYPDQARKAGITGEVLLEVHTDKNGKVISTKILNVQSSFEDGFGIWHLYIAAREAVSQWTFERFYFVDHNREAIFTVAVNFE